MEPPSSRTPSPQPMSTPPRTESPKSGSPRTPIPRSPARSPLKQAVRIEKRQLNDAPIPPSTSIPNANDRVKEVKDSIIQKTLDPLCELWNHKKIVEEALKKLPKKSVEHSQKMQLLNSLNKQIQEFDVDQISTEFLMFDLKRLKLSGKDTEDFCVLLLSKMDIKTVFKHLNDIFSKEVEKAEAQKDATLINRESSDVAQIFVTAFQKAHLDKIFDKPFAEMKFSSDMQKAGLEIIDKIIKGIKEGKTSFISDFYSLLYSKIESKFPGRGEDLALSLILLRYVGPSFLMPVQVKEGKAEILDINKKYMKVVQSFVSLSSPQGIELSSDYMKEGQARSKAILTHIISISR